MSPEVKPPLTTTTSLWPAGAVLGIAVAILGIFMVINLLANKGVTKTTAVTLPVIVGGLQRDPFPGATLTSCSKGSEIPANIASGFVFPVHTTARGAATTPNSGAGDFDCYQPFVTSGANGSALIHFFNTQLEARNWNLFSRGQSDGEPQSLFQKAGSDGFYWVEGITVTRSTSTSVDWTLRVYQNSQTI